MTRLTELQRELLTRAAADPDGAVDAPVDAKLSRPLIKQQLAISLPVTGGGSRLVITTAGRAAIAADGEAALADPGTVSQPAAVSDDAAGAPPGEALASGEAAASEPRTEPDDAEPAAPGKRPGGKLGTLVELLSRPSGATLDEMVAATGWLPHSVRGAMSGGLKKKQGLAITSAKTDGTRVYRLVSAETD